MERLRPVYRLDADERHPLIAVDGQHSAAEVYGRTVRDRGRTWLQYWTYHSYNAQDRGVVRSGRHEGDWELVQLRLRGAEPDLAVYARHSWAEACPWPRVRRERGAPVVYVAHGSHAAHFTPGVHDRPWPDPNDEADGRGVQIRPELRRISRRAPGWMRRSQPWGDSRARLPGEQSSPRGPAFQRERFDRPSAFAAAARACGSGAPPHPLALRAGLLGTPVLAAAALALLLVRRRR